jgi:hypothetical protein
MKMLADNRIPSTYEDDERRTFIQQHIEFFSETNEINEPDRINVEILWPKLDDYLATWRDTKHTDPYKTGRDMAADLDAAGISPPEWPREGKSPPPSKRHSFSRELDDEVPF